MNVIGIDLSLRSTGCCVIINNEVNFKLINPDSKTYNDEKLIIYITDEVLAWIRSFEITPDKINIEGLSFGSLSGSKDILAGNFWYLRCKLYQLYPNTQINIISVHSWRAPLFDKKERAKIKEYNTDLKLIKKESKDKTLAERKQIALDSEYIILGSDIKYQTYLKLPLDIKNKIDKYKTGRYDLTDAYWITKSFAEK